MRQIRFDSFGKPEDQAALTEAAAPEPAVGELRLRVLAAPINPADINYIEGTYGIKPELPAVPGNEVCAEILGDGGHAIVMRSGGLWQDEIVAREDEIIRLPGGIDPLQSCQLKVNPPTAWLLLKQFRDLPPGSWVAQNAANSAVGQCVIQIAKSLGLKTINFVRRPELIAELEALGADAVLIDEKDSVATARELTGGEGPALACNAVGGDSALRLMDLLAPRGTMVTYGAMSRMSLKVPNSFLIFKRIELVGLWVTEWFKEAAPGEVAEVYKQLAEMMAAGELRLPVEKAYPLEEIAFALTHAQTSGRSGKVLIDFTQSDESETEA